MNKIYDNGALMLGNVQDLIMEIEREIKKDIDMLGADMEELIKDLKELRDIDCEMVVCINYDNGMSYSIDYWSSNDIINKESEENSMQLKDISYEELLGAIEDYISDNYDYELCEDFGNELQYTLKNGKHINIYINVESEEE